MARLHLRYRRDSFNDHVMMLTERFFAVEPWRGSDEEKGRKFDTWLHGAAMAYGVPYPVLEVAPPKARPRGRSVGSYDPATGTINLQRFSVISMFHQFRHHLQACTMEEGKAWTHDDEKMAQDAQEWACSLFYIVAPRRFRRYVRRGRIAGVNPPDLLKRRSQ